MIPGFNMGAGMGVGKDFHTWELVGSTSFGAVATIAYPSGVQAGDLLLCYSRRSNPDEDGFSAWRGASGWTQNGYGNLGSSGLGYKGGAGHMYRSATSALTGSFNNPVYSAYGSGAVYCYRPPVGFSFVSRISHTMVSDGTGSISLAVSSANYPVVVWGFGAGFTPAQDVSQLAVYANADAATAAVIAATGARADKYLAQFAYG